jgi:photosystem II stability/assembly factor-like uncharacterized protein
MDLRKGGIATMVKRVFFTTLILVFAATFAYGQWIVQESGTSSFLSDVHFVDANHGWAVGSTNTILHTSDGGENWEAQEVDPSSNYSAVFFIDNQEGWAVGNLGKIVHTVDGGENWVTQSANEYESLTDVYFIDSETGWISGGRAAGFPGPDPARYILYTTNGGETWSEQYYESNETSWAFSGIHFADAENGWAVGASGLLFHTSDGGANWYDESYDTYSDLEAVHFVSETTGWIAGQDGLILFTENGGTNWTPQSSGLTEQLNDIQFLDESYGWAVAGSNDDGIVIYTEDGGVNWMEEESNTTDYLDGVHFIDMDTGWAVGFNGTIIYREGQPSGIDEDFTETPSTLRLHQNYPNPFNPETTIDYDLPVSDDVTLKIYDSSGKLIREWMYQNQSVGRHSVHWDGTDADKQTVASGIYVYTLETDRVQQRRKMVLLR